MLLYPVCFQEVKVPQKQAHLETKTDGVTVPQGVQFQRLHLVVAAAALLLLLAANTHSIVVERYLGGRRGDQASALKQACHKTQRDMHVCITKHTNRQKNTRTGQTSAYFVE